MTTNTPASTSDDRVAVYVDFDNVIISRRDQAARHPGVDANVDVDAILDFASSYGTLTTSRAYADWSRTETMSYRERLLSRAVDTIQMFTTSGKIKNAADIRLSIDVLEDMFLLPDLTHVVIVAGDSDYIPLAQRVKRMGRRVIGIGVAGSTSRMLAAACDEFYDYDELPGLRTEGTEDDEDESAEPADSQPEPDAAASKTPRRRSGRARRAAGSPEGTAPETEPDAAESEPEPTEAPRESGRRERSGSNGAISKSRATQLLLRALTYSTSKTEEEWHDASEIKKQVLRMEPAFQESALGFGSFTAFVKSRGGLVEMRDDGNQRLLRLRESGR